MKKGCTLLLSSLVLTNFCNSSVVSNLQVFLFKVSNTFYRSIY